ncbi:hypothetical protein ACXA45_11235 [Neomicrococcus lactis]
MAASMAPPKKLASLGFIITGMTGDTAETFEEEPGSHKSFALLWNPKKWHWEQEDFQAIQTKIEVHGCAEYEWSTRSRHFGINPGDRLFLFMICAKERGVIGSGNAISDIDTPKNQDSEVSEDPPFLNVLWDNLLEPNAALDWKELLESVPKFPNSMQSGGQKFGHLTTLGLENVWQQHLEQVLLSDNGDQQESGVLEVEAAYKFVRTKTRLHQSKFRQLLLQNYPATCLVCGLSQIAVLEAAHIISDSAGGSRPSKTAVCCAETTTALLIRVSLALTIRVVLFGGKIRRFSSHYRVHGN